MTMFEPASASPSAMRSPIPVAPPVTTLTRPSRFSNSFTFATLYSLIFEQHSRDDVALDLGGPFVDPHDARVAIRRFDADLAHVTHAAVDLHCAVRDFRQRLGAEDLCGRSFHRAALTA